MKNSIFARFARAFFIFWHFIEVLVPSTTWNDLFCSCVDDVIIRWQMFNVVFLCPKRSFQFNSRIVRTHFSSMMTLNNWKMIAETRSFIFKRCSRFRRRRVCLSSLMRFCRRRNPAAVNFSLSAFTWRLFVAINVKAHFVHQRNIKHHATADIIVWQIKRKWSYAFSCVKFRNLKQKLHRDYQVIRIKIPWKVRKQRDNFIEAEFVTEKNSSVENTLQLIKPLHIRKELNKMRHFGLCAFCFRVYL